MYFENGKPLIIMLGKKTIYLALQQPKSLKHEIISFIPLSK